MPALSTENIDGGSSAGLFTALVAAAAAYAVYAMLPSAGAPDWTAVTILLLVACMATRLRLEMPAVEGIFSLAFVFSFSAIATLPALWAFAVIASVEVFEYLLADDHGKISFGRLLFEVLFRVSVAALCVPVAAAILNGLGSGDALSWGLALGLAAVAYFLVQTALRSIQIAIQQSRSPWDVWRNRFFWTSPIYLLAPFGVVVVGLLLEPRSFWDSLLAIAVIGGAYFYLRSYFPRLHDREDRAQSLADIRQRALETLAVAIEAKDGSTAGHLRRVKLLATQLGRKKGCNPEEIRTLQLAAVLHDVGKVGVPDYILQKPSRLDEREFQTIATHAAIGAGIVSAMDFPEPVDEVVLCHHEHWDGSGYPRGLTGENIPPLARILTVVDCFDALISDRPYRKAMSMEKAIELMQRQRGTIFDPHILDLFLDELPSHMDQLVLDLAADREASKVAAESAPKIKQTWIHDEVDIIASSRIKTLQKLSRRPDHLAAFYEVLSVLGADLHFERTFQEALRIIAQQCGARTAALFVHSPKKGKFVLQASSGLPAHCTGRLWLSASTGVVGEAVETKAPAMGDTPPVSDGEEPRCTLAVPLIVQERIVGMILVCAERPEAFDPDQTLFLSLLAEKMSSTLVASQQLRKIHIDANTDTVTSLPNARASFLRLEQELNRARRQEQTIGVLFMDLDGLKPVNDSYGHAAGDRLLAATAARLRQSLRSYDFVGRIGGDEFLAILPGIKADDMMTSVEHMKKMVSESTVELGVGIQVRPMISVGAALFPEDASDPDELIYLSDQRMYDDKERSRRKPVDPSLTATPLKAKATTAGD
jgi:diguanylate cyclase (GGDEF)-like protein